MINPVDDTLAPLCGYPHHNSKLHVECLRLAVHQHAYAPHYPPFSRPSRFPETAAPSVTIRHERRGKPPPRHRSLGLRQSPISQLGRREQRYPARQQRHLARVNVDLTNKGANSHSCPDSTSSETSANRAKMRSAVSRTRSSRAAGVALLWSG